MLSVRVCGTSLILPGGFDVGIMVGMCDAQT